MQKLKGKTAIITGASKGIGKATAIEMSKQGAAVVISSRSQTDCDKVASEINSSGSRALAVRCDISKPEEAENLLNQTLKWQSGLDILVNNAGIIEPLAKIADCNPRDWLGNITINLLGTFNVTKAVLKYFLKNKEGVIINLSSSAAIHALSSWSAYCTSKAGISMFNKCIDLEYGKDGIMSYAIRPGVIFTDMLKKAVDAGTYTATQKNCLPAKIPAKLITWLASEKPKDLTGKMVDVFGREIQKRAGLDTKALI